MTGVHAGRLFGDEAVEVEPALRLFLAGDMMLGRGIDQVMPNPSNPLIFGRERQSALDYVTLAEEANGSIPRPVGFDYVWGDALKVLDEMSPRARLANLETTITVSDKAWRAKRIHFRMHPDNVECLKAAGIDCVSLANNHSLDWGYEGLDETMRTLDSAGICHAGAGDDFFEAGAPAELDIGHGRRLKFYACCTEDSGLRRYWNATPEKPGVHEIYLQNPRWLPDQVRLNKKSGDLIVVSIHWGGNWGYTIPSSQKKLAHRLIDAGADVVHGHSSHHAKGIEVYKGRPIFYGCGDLINDYEGLSSQSRFRGDLSLLYFPEFDPQSGTLSSLEIQAMQVRNFRLNHATEEDKAWLVNMLNKQGNRLGSSAELLDNGRLALRWNAPL
ncbi:MAG: CapA family protein [Gammaproteobacteria bacterium]|nr:CapA family protein [Gammaproteobacteria bacterium]NNE05196.1 CapA family protein [Xanthomonadales bacterium]